MHDHRSGTHRIRVVIGHRQVVPHGHPKEVPQRYYHPVAAIQPLDLLPNAQILRVHKSPIGGEERMATYIVS